MAGVVSPSMWVFVLEDPNTGRTAVCSLNEGLGKVLRYGAYGPEVIDRLRWMSEVLGPAAAGRGPRERTGRHHGDPRPDAADGRRGAQPQPRRHADAAARAAARPDRLGRPDVRRRRGRALRRRQRPLLPQPRDARLQAGHRRRARRRGSTMVVAMARNGTDFGIQVSGTGDEWFTGPAQVPRTGCSSATTGPRTPTPTSATRRSPRPPGSAASRWPPPRRSSASSAATVADALANTRRMYEITLGENAGYQIPVLDFRGTPTGIDVTLVVRTGDPSADQHGDGRQGAGHRSGGGGTRDPTRGMLHCRAGRPRGGGPSRLTVRVGLRRRAGRRTSWSPRSTQRRARP